MIWKIAAEDRKFSEIAEKALHEERQRVQTDEGVVVVISEEELNRIEETRNGSKQQHLDMPKVDVEISTSDQSVPEPDDQGERRNPLVEYLKNGPGFEGVDISRDKSPAREVKW